MLPETIKRRTKVCKGCSKDFLVHPKKSVDKAKFCSVKCCLDALTSEQRAEIARKATTHGMYGTRFYKIWGNMKQRCLNQRLPNYIHYGGRGITVQPEWLSYEGFYKDMYESYLEHAGQYGEINTTIERIDVNGDYSKSNCCWATRLVQAGNRRDVPSKSGYKGVVYRGAKYYAVFQTTGYHKYLGSYDTAEEAYKVSQEARRKYFEERTQTRQGAGGV